MAEQKKRKYRRRCGYCGELFEQNEMVRTLLVRNGWLCKRCYHSEFTYGWISGSEDFQLRVSAAEGEY